MGFTLVKGVKQWSWDYPVLGSCGVLVVENEGSGIEMDFLENLKEEYKSPGLKCWYSKVHAEDPEMAEKLDKAVEDGYPYAAIARAFVGHPLAVGRTSVAGHYRNDCACPNK